MGKLLPAVFDNMFTMNSDVHSYATRSSAKIHPARIYTELGRRFITYNGVTFWNEISDKFGSCKTIKSFKKLLKQHLIQSQGEI